MKRRLSMVVAALVALGLSLALTSCGTKSYTVTFDLNGGEGTAPSSMSVDKDSTVTLTDYAVTDYTKSGYTALGWNTATDSTEILSTYTVTDDVTFYVVWTDKPVVTFNTNGGSTIASVAVESGSAVSAPTDPTKAGYTFGGWYSDSALTTAYDFTTAVTASITLYAKWTATSYNITYNLNNGENSTSNPSTYTIESDTITLSAPSLGTATGVFGGWYSIISPEIGQQAEEITNFC